MKYYTKEWFHTREGSNTYELLQTANEAATYNEGYYQTLYNDRLQEHLNTNLEMSKLTVDDVFPLDAWGSVSTIDTDGNFVDVTSMVSTEEFEKIREGIRREELKARERFVPIVYDEELLTKQFQDRMNGRRAYLEVLLPQDIIKDVADTRVLALDIAAPEIYDRISWYCREREEKSYRIEQDYQEYYQRIYPMLPEKLQKYYGFHDCRVTGYEQQGTEVIITLDRYGGYSNVSKIIYHDVTILEGNEITGFVWVYDEIYPLEEGYEFHAFLQGGDGEIKYFTLKAADVDFILEEAQY